MSDHLAIITPDDRGRFPLRRFLGKRQAARYRLYVEAGGRRIVLELADDEGSDG